MLKDPTKLKFTFSTQNVHLNTLNKIKRPPSTHRQINLLTSPHKREACKFECLHVEKALRNVILIERKWCIKFAHFFRVTQFDVNESLASKESLLV
jgi:hypothetical protein